MPRSAEQLAHPVLPPTRGLRNPPSDHASFCWRNVATLCWCAAISWSLIGCDGAVQPEPAPVPTAPALPGTAPATGEATTSAAATSDATTSDAAMGAAPAAEASASADATTRKKFRGVTFSIPTGWEETPVSSGFLEAEYQIPSATGAGSVRVTISQAGGGQEANFERWRGQFQRAEGDPEPRESTVTANGETIPVLEAFGTFVDRFRGSQPQPHWGTLGAAFEQPEGQHLYVKATGSQAALAEQRAALIALIESATR